MPTRGRTKLQTPLHVYWDLGALRFFVVRFMAKRCIVEQKCQKGQIETCMLGARWYNFYPRTPAVRATMHSVTDGQTDGQQAAGNSRSFCVTVRSAKKAYFWGPLCSDYSSYPSCRARLMKLVSITRLTGGP